MMKPLEKLWAVYTNSDLTEGRGRQYLKHLCESRATAVRLARRGYVQGTDCPISEVEVLQIDGKAVLPINLLDIIRPTDEDRAEDRQNDIRKAALEKAKSLGMSDEELQILGVI